MFISLIACVITVAVLVIACIIGGWLDERQERETVLRWRK